MAPISAVIGTVIAVTVAIAWIGVRSIAWIGVGVTRIAILVMGRIIAVARVTSTVTWINSSVAWVAGINVNGNALGRCFERNKHRQAKSDRAHKNGG